MTPTEAAALLTVCAAYDNRKPDADQAKAWALALDGLPFQECRDAIVAHYRSSREWIMPADVWRTVNRDRTGRIADAPPVPIPNGFDPDDTAAYQELLRESRRAQADGRTLVMPDYNPTRTIGELRGVLKAIPAPVRPPAPRNTSEHDVAKARARAELRARAEVPVAEPETDALLEANGGLATPAMQETDEEGEARR